ncbi:hypothetical protein L6164_012336 [Bauhinia variegata]|uniref:Uncharacterized protein n=1 Tax=Bauhinia variegata TaxID=167791 RepID=A0ACB9P8V2_BAUVA|nr:hypothetical protein L6164_012336 [Bauhinia variegata]
MDAASSVPPLHCSGCLPSNETENGEDKSSVTIDSGDNPSHSRVESHPSGSIPTDDGVKPLKKCKKKMKLKKRVVLDVSEMTSSSSFPPSVASLHRGFEVGCKRRNPRFLVRRNGGDVAAIGLPLGMSFAAVIAQVLYRRDAAAQRMSIDHLSSMCTSAVRESLTNVFGDRLDGLMRNFEQSFGSTLSTLKLIYETSTSNEGNKFNNVKIEDPTSELTLNRGDCTRDVSREDDHLEAELLSRIQDQSNSTEEIVENIPTESICRDLALHGQSNHLVSLTPISSGSVFERSVMEQRRSNDLKTLELSLTMNRLKLKESQLALNLDANNLGRSKLAMGISKASFKAEKFKNELEEHRYAELVKKCIDCLIAGLLIMSFSMLYGAYVYSYERITEATASCTPSAKESRSWWTPKSVASFNSSVQQQRPNQCQLLLFFCYWELLVAVVANYVWIHWEGVVIHGSYPGRFYAHCISCQLSAHQLCFHFSMDQSMHHKQPRGI